VRRRLRPQLKLPLPPAARWPLVLIAAVLAIWLTRSSSVAVRFTPTPKSLVWGFTERSIVIAPARATDGTPGPAEAKIHRVIDGDTVELADGRLVRYIGIDTPEVRRRVDGRWVMDPEPFALEAAAANRELVEGKTVRCEYDVQTYDRYGRLLAYVFIGETMVNEELVRRGMAQPLTIRPDVRYTDRFQRLAREARQANRGLWSKR